MPYLSILLSLPDKWGNDPINCFLEQLLDGTVLTFAERVTNTVMIRPDKLLDYMLFNAQRATKCAVKFVLVR